MMDEGKSGESRLVWLTSAVAAGLNRKYCFVTTTDVGDVHTWLPVKLASMHKCPYRRWRMWTAALTRSGVLGVLKPQLWEAWGARWKVAERRATQ